MNETALGIRGLCAGYVGREVLHDIDLDVMPGDWLALVGPNGSGKSTLLDCATGCLTPAAGSISIVGYALDSDPLSAKQRLGYAVPPSRLPELLTGRQCLQIHATAKQAEARLSELSALASQLRLDELLDEPVGVYSYGTRQKLSILLALVGDPVLILLDEAFSGLDSASALVLKRHLRQRVATDRCAVVLATHALDIVERYANRMILLNEGNLVGHWDGAALDALRPGGADAFESALAARLDAHSADTEAQE